MIKVNLIDYKLHPDPKFPGIEYMGSATATIEITKSLLGFTYSKETRTIYKVGFLWRYEGSGKYVETNIINAVDAAIFFKKLLEN